MRSPLNQTFVRHPGPPVPAPPERAETAAIHAKFPAADDPAIVSTFKAEMDRIGKF